MKIVQYLTDDIYVKEEIMYYKNKPIKKYNWHHILCDIGWNKLNKNWIKKLNSYNPNSYKNSLFGVLDVPSDGNCLFHCIAEALSSSGDVYYESQDIRILLSKEIDEGTFNMIISIYRCLKDSEDFDEDWDPYEINKLQDFKDKLINGGHEYWCDHILLELLVKTLKLNIFILESNEEHNDKYQYLSNYNKKYKSIILLYSNGNHFQLIGNFQGYMKQLFDDKNLPIEIKKMYNLN